MAAEIAMVALGLMLALTVGVTVDERFDGSRLPEQQTPPWSWRQTPNSSVGVDGGALHVVDDGTAKGELQFINRAWSAAADQPATVTAEVKVARCSGEAGVVLIAANGEREAALTLYPDRLEMPKGGLSAKVRLDDAFHRVSLMLRGDDMRVTVEDAVVFDRPGQWTLAAYEHRNLVGFGSLSSPATGEAWWRSVRTSLEYPAVTLWPGATHHSVYYQKDVYACFPSLVQADDGTLLTWFGTRVRRSHLDATGGSAQRVSLDGGVTWTEPPARLTVANPASLRADGSRVSAGAIGWREADATKRDELVAKGLDVREVRPGVIAYASGAWFQVTGADGQPLKPRTEIPLPPHKLVMGYNQSAVARVGKVRLVAIYATTPDGKHDTWLLRSTDDGDTWDCRVLARGTDEVSFDETALGVTPSGRVVALLRTEQGRRDRGYLYESVSDDQGATWSSPVNTGLWGYPANLLTLPDGRLLASYGYRRPPMGIRAALSRDEGRTWDAAHGIVLRADGHGNGSDLGYPITTRQADGTLVTVYYFNDRDNVTHIAATRWRLPAE